MAKGPEQEDAFLHLPAAQAVPSAAQEESYAGLAGRALLPFAQEGLCAPAGAQRGLPEPALPAGIKSETRFSSQALSSEEEDADPGDGALKAADRSPSAKRSITQIMKDKKKQTQLTLQWYHYYGIGIKESSAYYHSVYSGKGLTRYNNITSET
ncbi:dna-binding protein rfx6 [Limosa lapponica baueri]|uniref:Dna-binding protein rfx6 n=1 Tax=Limosa lapponica baueri TaxID=1758121 RepID=A0A2I0UGA3_LIMLA|nr:dna-binding protein rfx6 [Limosa lapponica baueri]